MANRFHRPAVSTKVRSVHGCGRLGGLVGLSWAMGSVVAAMRGAPVATAGPDTVTATAIEVTAVTPASTNRVVGEWRDFMPIAFYREVV